MDAFPRYAKPSEYQRGFSLVELLVVATVMAVLSVVGVVSYTNLNKKSRDSKRNSDMEQLRSALEMFRADNGFYPAVNTTGFGTAGELDTGNAATGLVPTYLPAIPTDPKAPTQDYYYYPTNLTGGNYYGYCICGDRESQTEAEVSTCLNATLPGGTLPANCNYGLKNP